MPKFFSNKKLIILLVSIIVTVVLIGFSIQDRQKLSWSEKVIKDTVGLFQTVFNQPAQMTAGFFERIGDILNTYEENKLLKSRLDEYVMLHEQVNELEKENKKLKEIVDKKESIRDFKAIQATVIARNPDQWSEIISVNKGSQHGVKKNMAVITAKGMIGKVKYASEFTSTIQLLSDIDRTNRISVVVSGDENIFGLIEGYDANKDALLFKKIPFNAQIKKDQVVISSGLGGVFPRGLIIGSVTEVLPDEYGLTQTAYVKPAADFYDIDHVMIIERKIAEPDQAFFKEEGVE